MDKNLLSRLRDVRILKELKHDLKQQRPGELKSVLKIDPCSLASGPKIDHVYNPLIIMSKSRYILLLLGGGGHFQGVHVDKG